ncbi:MAG: hypothetical protein JKY37_17105 [Nannocystaceae bacterium]|nr:hypothetical protein [Nannocystaceae bacterium]
MSDRKPTPCTEIYIYTVRGDAVEAMLALKDRLIEEARTLDGLLASSTFRSNDDPNVFADQMVWRDEAAAVAGGTAFRELPSSGAFMALMAGPPSGGRFHHVAGRVPG